MIKRNILSKTIEENYKNYEINYEEYKKLLNQLGFIKSDITENENEKNKINSSFNDYLNPKDGKIDTNKFLAFCLAALGIYKGKDEKIIEHNSKITPKFTSINVVLVSSPADNSSF